MKILTQDRTQIMEMRSYVFSTPENNTGKFGIRMVPHAAPIGIYESEKRGKEVMREMFQCFSDGKKAYVMPEK